jgi:uncharacterized membrane protein
MNSAVASAYRAPDSRLRLVLSLIAGTLSAGVVAQFDRWQMVVLIGWDVAAFSYLAMVWCTIARLDGESTKQLSTREDDSRAAVDIVLLLASVVSVVGVVAGLAESGGEVSLLMAASMVTVVLSWFTVHTTFTLRYAHLYYSTGGGLDFHDQDGDPDFADFAYLAFTVGMTFQVSDTEVTSRVIRRTISRHALLAYLFGTAIIGVTINVVGTLVG